MKPNGYEPLYTLRGRRSLHIAKTPLAVKLVVITGAALMGYMGFDIARQDSEAKAFYQFTKKAPTEQVTVGKFGQDPLSQTTVDGICLSHGFDNEHIPACRRALGELNPKVSFSPLQAGQTLEVPVVNISDYIGEQNP